MSGKALWLSLPNAKKREAKAKKPIRKVSKTQSKRLRKYYAIRLWWLSLPENRICHVCQKRKAVDVHHKKSRIGDMLFQTAFWAATCRWCHTKLHNNVAWAYKEGWMLSRV